MSANRPRRLRRPTVKSLIDRIYRVITHNLDVMERRMSEEDATAAGANPDRDVRAINSLVRSVEKLKELEPDTAKRDPVSEGRYPLTREEEDQLRDEIVERLLELRKRRRDQGPAE
jgi:hypothetical protein